MPANLLSTLIDRQKITHGVLPAALRQLYGGDLAFPAAPDNRPHVIANLVTTLDGVASYIIPGKSGGGEISGFDEADRFVMGLLRASVDAVIIGARTLHETSAKHLWTASAVYPAASELYAEYRQDVLRKPGNPLNVIVSASGIVDLDRAVFHTPGLHALVITTVAGRSKIEAGGLRLLASTQVRAIGSGGTILPAAIVQLLREEFGVRLLLSEGGPRLLGALFAAHVIDELFVTIAPQVAGRSSPDKRNGLRRPGLVEGTEFMPGSAPWLELVSAKNRGHHLYLRYLTREQPEASARPQR